MRRGADAFGLAQRADALVRLPLFPLKTVLFPRGRLALRIFEQRYSRWRSAVSPTTRRSACASSRQGEEVTTPGMRRATVRGDRHCARIETWDMPQLGILQIAALGAERFRRTHATRSCRWTRHGGRSRRSRPSRA
jgi:Lon protease-like protein